jgi:hypothetical protein
MATFGAVREILSYNSTYKLQDRLAVEGDIDLAGVVSFKGGFTQKIPNQVVVRVDLSDGGEDEETAIVTVPAGSVLLAVLATVVVAADGDTSKTLEVGIEDNADAYIDTSDFNPGAAAGTQACSVGGTNNDVKTFEYLADATPIIATWTHTDAGEGPTTGAVDVTVIYL